MPSPTSIVNVSNTSGPQSGQYCPCCCCGGGTGGCCYGGPDIALIVNAWNYGTLGYSDAACTALVGPIFSVTNTVIGTPIYFPCGIFCVYVEQVVVNTDPLSGDAGTTTSYYYALIASGNNNWEIETFEDGDGVNCYTIEGDANDAAGLDPFYGEGPTISQCCKLFLAYVSSCNYSGDLFAAYYSSYYNLDFEITGNTCCDETDGTCKHGTPACTGECGDSEPNPFP